MKLYPGQKNTKKKNPNKMNLKRSITMHIIIKMAKNKKNRESLKKQKN